MNQQPIRKQMKKKRKIKDVEITLQVVNRTFGTNKPDPEQTRIIVKDSNGREREIYRGGKWTEEKWKNRFT